MYFTRLGFWKGIRAGDGKVRKAGRRAGLTCGFTPYYNYLLVWRGTEVGEGRKSNGAMFGRRRHVYTMITADVVEGGGQ